MCNHAAALVFSHATMPIAGHTIAGHAINSSKTEWSPNGAQLVHTISTIENFIFIYVHFIVVSSGALLAPPCDCDTCDDDARTRADFQHHPTGQEALTCGSMNGRWLVCARVRVRMFNSRRIDRKTILVQFEIEVKNTP